MSITDRLRFIARSYLNAARKRGSRVLDENGLSPLDVGSLSDDELETEIRRKVEAELRSEATDANRHASGGTGRTKTSRGTGSGSSASAAAKRRLAQCYANLELTPGAAADEIHKAWRRLVLKYHPDRYPGDPAKVERATRITQIVNESYNTLLEHLGAEKKK